MVAQLDELIRREMERSRLAGLAIALVKGDEIVWSGGYGYADLETKTRVEPSTVFSVQSVTKPIVTTALMQWYDRGRFRLDDPVNDHLAPLRVENEWEKTRPVTIRQLLTHTSGLPVELGALTPPETKQSLEELISAVAKTVRPPGEEIVYANWGYDITGYLVGRFAGQPYDAYLREHVLQPLEMSSSAIGAPPEGAIAATGYFLSAIDGEHHAPEPFGWPTEPPDPAGSLVSTVEDLGRFLIAHLNGGVYSGRRILSEDTIAHMHSLHARAGSSQGGMGLGFRVDHARGRRLICHGGDGATFTALIAAHPDERVGVALLVNQGRAQTARSVIGQAALAALLGEELENERPSSVIEIDWERLTGRYVSNFWGIAASLTVDDGTPSLHVEGGIISTVEGERSELVAVGEGTVRGRGGPFDGFELTFEFDPAGQAQRFCGGLYPFCFDRQGDVAPAAARSIDERANLTGGWHGTVSSPVGPVPLSLSVDNEHRATVTVLSAQDAPLKDCCIERGRLSGQVDVTVPGLGNFAVALRLGAVDGALRGHAFARYRFGEVPMRAELERA